jgi:hypothetical protein
MDVLIKNVDADAYARFKSEAAARRLRLGEAASSAFSSWAGGGRMSEREKNELLVRMKEIRSRNSGVDGTAIIRRFRDGRR